MIHIQLVVNGRCAAAIADVKLEPCDPGYHAHCEPQVFQGHGKAHS